MAVKKAAELGGPPQQPGSPSPRAGVSASAAAACLRLPRGEIKTSIYSGPGGASRRSEEGHGGDPCCRWGAGRALRELVPPGSVPSRPLREGDAFLKAATEDERRRELCPCGAFKSREQCPGAA